jgi:putative flippase GtrA
MQMRFLRFTLVNALGVVVQLCVFAALVHVMDAVAATALAVATAVIHNFAWHWHWTWPGSRHGPRPMVDRFLRFALANGVVSLTGNTVLMLMLVGSACLRPLPASLVAIGVCGLFNFWTSNRFVFGTSGPGD